MVLFNIKETGSELLRFLEKELQPRGEYRLTRDVLIPDVLKGDREGLCTSILMICEYLNQRLQDYSVNIELSKKSHPGESFLVKVDIKGITGQQESIQKFLRAHRTNVDA